MLFLSSRIRLLAFGPFRRDSIAAIMASFFERNGLSLAEKGHVDDRFSNDVRQIGPIERNNSDISNLFR